MCSPTEELKRGSGRERISYSKHRNIRSQSVKCHKYIIRYSYDTLCASGSRRFFFGLLSFCHDRRSASPSATNRQLTKSTTNNASTPLALRLTLMTMDGSFHFLDYGTRDAVNTFILRRNIACLRERIFNCCNVLLSS